MYRDNYQWCGNQKFFGKTHRLTVLEKKFVLENGQPFLGGNYKRRLRRNAETVFRVSEKTLTKYNNEF